MLRMQLSLLHAQLESVLTRSALGVLFRKAPSYDLRRLLGRWVGRRGRWVGAGRLRGHGRQRAPESF